MKSFHDFLLLLEDQASLDRLKQRWAGHHLQNVDDLGMTAHLSNEFKNEYDDWKDFRFDPVKLSAHQHQRYNHHIIEKLGSHDPTPTHKYTEYMLGQYRKKHIRSEDLPWVHDTLESFERHKHLLPQKDINQYKRIHDLRDALRPYQEGAKSSNAEDWDRIKKEGIEEIFNNGKGLRVVKLKTKEASCALYGDKTDWCTAFKDKHNQFDYYNRMGPLYVVHTPKQRFEAEDRMYQLHFPSEQAMDEKDSSINVEGLVHDHPDLRQVKEFRQAALKYPKIGFHFLEPEEVTKLTTKWASKGNATQKELAIKHGGEEAHMILAKDPKHNIRFKFKLASETDFDKPLKHLARSFEPSIRMKAQYRLDQDFNDEAFHPLMHWSTHIPEGSEHHLKALSRTYHEHEQYFKPRKSWGFVIQVNHQTIDTTQSWHRDQMSRLYGEYEKHFPELAAKHGLGTTSETVLIHALRKLSPKS